MPFDFAEVFRREIDVINFRRHAIQDGRVISARAGLRASASKGRAAPRRTGYTVPRADAKLVSGDAQAGDREPVSTTPESNLTGLALSGGGVRSASLCLGVLQALDSLCGEDEPEPLDAFDYISAVSGGGYIGTSLVAGLLQSNGSFPFDSKLDQQETPETQHLRDFSNFLAPNGMVDYLVSAALDSARPAGQRRHHAARSADPGRCHNCLESACCRSHPVRHLRRKRCRLAVAAARHSRDWSRSR